MAKTRTIVFRFLLGAILLAGLLLRYAGLCEPLQLHPDERNIALWMDRMHAQHSLRPQTYAGGFFVLADLARKTAEWTQRYGSHRWAYFIRATDVRMPPRTDPVAFGRTFNVWMGTLAVLLGALLAGRVARSRAAALTAAALLAFTPFAIEHAHYLESDVAMLATLALALLGMARFLATRKWRDWILAALATGFAAGTKFPLALLILPLLASLRPPRSATSRPRAVAGTVGMLLVALPLVAAGFAAASPDALHFSEFMAGMKAAGAAVYAETAEILGPLADQPHARQWMNAANLFRFARTLRPGWLLIAAVGIPLCAVRRLRPFWPITLLFPALWLGYIVWLAPWSRSQEFMALLPILCLWAALPVAALWNARGAPATRIAALVLCALAVLPVAKTGLALSSQFAWEDTRRLANRQLKACFPKDRPLVAELYSAPAETGVSSHTIPISEYAADVASLPAGPDSSGYFLLNADFCARGLRDPLTRVLFPPYAQEMKDLQTHGRRIATWASLESTAPQPYFRAPRIELWWRSAGDRPASGDEPVELPRPAWVRDEGRTTFFRSDLRAGPRIAVPVDRFAREIAIGGPGPLDGPVFLVFSTRERAADVEAQGFGRTRRLELDPYDAGAIPLERPWWNLRWSRYERVAVRSETGGATLTYLPCFLHVAFDPVEAATLLLDEGHLDKAVDLLRRHGVLAQAGPFWRALAGDPDATPDAEALLAQWDQWLAQDETRPPPVCFGGIPLAIWQDFARIRLVEPDEPVLLQLPLAPAKNAERRTLAFAQILPVFGAAQTLAMSLGRHPDSAGNTNFFGTVALDADDQTEIGRFEFADLPDPAAGETEWSRTSAELPRNVLLTFRARSGGAIRVEDAQWTWSWRDMLARRAKQLRRALSDKPVPAAVRYGDWLAVRGCRVENGQILLDLEALQNAIPPFAAQLRIFQRGKWRPRETVPLGEAPAPWRRGERKTVRLPLENGLEPDRVGIALQTDVPWHPSVVPLADAPAERPFPTLAELLQAP